jgi:hypothetical protein
VKSKESRLPINGEEKISILFETLAFLFGDFVKQKKIEYIMITRNDYDYKVKWNKHAGFIVEKFISQEKEKEILH